MFNVSDRMKSFGYALQGIGFVLKTQHNAWIHLVATVGVMGAAAGVGMSAADWRWVVAAVGLVWVAELVNTAVERVCDVVQPEQHAAVKAAKDVAAGAVLVAAVTAAAIGVLVFLPYLRA